MNAWSEDNIDREVRTMTVRKMHGYEKIYIGDETGRVFRLDTGHSDNLQPIHFIAETKRFNQDLPEERKTYRKAFVYTKNGQLANFAYSIDGGNWTTVGRLSKSLTPINLNEARGSDIAFRISQNDKGEGVALLGVGVQWARGEILNDPI
jgi:hypothetical protein